MKKSLFFVLIFIFVAQTFSQTVPELIAPKNGAEISSESLILSWEKYEGKTYQLQIATDTTFDSPVEVIISDINGYVFKNLTSKLRYKKTYFWRVAFFTTSNTLEWSEVRSFTLGVYNFDTIKKGVKDFFKKAQKG